ncbi:MAG: hemolysin family protein [Pseudomonadota bacterium]
MDRSSRSGSDVTGSSETTLERQANADSDGSSGRSPADSEQVSSVQLPVPYAPPRRRVLWQWFRRFLGISARDDLRESLADVLDNGHGETHELTDKERIMLRNVLELRDVRVEDVMVPRADIDAVDMSMSLSEIIRIFEDAGHSRLPVTRESLDDPVGLVHIKDVMGYITAKATQRRRKSPAKANAAGSASKTSSKNGKPSDTNVKGGKANTPAHTNPIDLARVDLSVPLKSSKLLRDVLYVPPSMPVGDLLVKMQADRMHMAIVVDEYGGTDGLVTIEDLVEEIVGEISDEHDDEDDVLIVSSGTTGFVADARTPIEDLQGQLGSSFQPDDEILEEVDTLGGLLFSHLGRVPVRGEIVDLPGSFEFEVIDADPRRVKRVRISPRRLSAATPTKRPAPARQPAPDNAPDRGNAPS